MVNRSIKIVFSLLVIVFILVMIVMMVPPVRMFLSEVPGPVLIFSPWIFFALLGILLIILTLKNKNKIEGNLRKFLFLAGASAVAFIIFAILHNLVSALLSVILHKEIDEPVFFILAVIVCPIVFLIGAIGSITLFIKKRDI